LESGNNTGTLTLHFNNMSRKQIFYIGFFAILVGVFYLVLISLVPELAKKQIPPISYIRPFSFINQNGKVFTEKDVSEKVFVAEYFFTTCKGICPAMNNNMKKVYTQLKDEKDFLILSHTCQPEIDSAGVLKKYADSMGVNTDKWVFLTGRKDSLYTMARVSYTIDDPANNFKSIDEDFLHTQFWALVDKNGDVKKVYDGLKESEVNLLIKDAKKLLKQKPATQ
jgi:protein SCO1